MMKQIFRVSMIAALMFAVVSSFAQDRDNPGRRRGGDRPGFRSREQGGRGQFNRGMRQNPRIEAEKKLKEKYPAEYAEIQKLRDEAEKKLQALAKKANIELPALPKTMEERMADLKKKYPKEMAEIESLQKTDRRAAFMKLRELMAKENGGKAPREGGNAPRMRSNPQKDLRAAQKKYPEEWKKIQQLRKSDPKKARQMTKELLEKYKKEGKK